VTVPRDVDSALRDAFQSMAARSTRDCAPEDVERIWQAVAGTLGIEQRRDLIDRMATDPALAQAWRVAHELERARQGELTLTAAPSRPWLRGALMGLAATLILATGVRLFYVNRAPSDIYRAGATYVVEPMITSDAALPRDAFVLRWKPGPEGSRYSVRATTEDLTLLTTAADLTSPELTVPRESLAPLAAGTRVLWQVVMSLPSGETVSSQTFVVRVQ
jgi:hypothetical protein